MASIGSSTISPSTVSQTQSIIPQNDPLLYQWVGNKFPLQPDDTSMVIGFSNLHRLWPSRTPLASSLQDLNTAASLDFKTSILGISEHQISAQDPRISQTVHQFTRNICKTIPTICQLNSSSKTSAGSARLMGGPGILAFNTMVGQLMHNGKGGDSMGRWSYVHLKRNQSAPVTVISIYQVCHCPTNKVGSTAWHPQRRALDRADQSHIHPRAAFLDNLISFISSLQQANHEIIVGGDWNDYLTAPNSLVLRLCTTLNLSDPWLQLHPDNPSFATHERGKQRIDSVFVSHTLLPVIESIGHSPVRILASSDHCAIFMKLSTDKLFGTRVTLTSPTLRHVQSNNKQSVTTFIETMYGHMLQHNVFQGSLELHDADTLLLHHQTHLVELLDTIVGQASTLGKKRSRKRRPEWYSIELVQQRLTVSYL
jgi:hypothetical protein